jgi:hypothetical protein
VQSRASNVLVCVTAILAACYAVLWRWVDFVLPAEINPMLFGLPDVLKLTESAPVSNAVITLGVVGVLAYSLLRFLLWLRIRRGNGSALLLAAAILGLVPLLAQLSARSAFLLGKSLPITLLVAVESVAASFGWLIQPLALFLLSLGLLRAKAAPVWIAILGLAAAVVLALSVPPGGGQLDLSWLSFFSGNRATYLVGVALETTFLVSLGLAAVLKKQPVPASG